MSWFCINILDKIKKVIGQIILCLFHCECRTYSNIFLNSLNCVILNRNKANKNTYLCTCIYYKRYLETGNKTA